MFRLERCNVLIIQVRRLGTKIEFCVDERGLSKSSYRRKRTDQVPLPSYPKAPLRAEKTVTAQNHYPIQSYGKWDLQVYPDEIADEKEMNYRQEVG